MDHHKIPVPQPRSRDKLLTTARQNYDSIAKKAGEYSAYPGDWLYAQWSESDLKAFLDERGIPVPQPTARDKLIATVRRNARLAAVSASSSLASATNSASSAASVASKSAASAQSGLTDALLDSWSESRIKEFLDEHGIPVPQGSKKNELVALARKNAAKYTGNAASTVSASASSGFHAATSKAGNEFAKATEEVKVKAESLFDSAVDTWSESRLKAFLDARGVPVPQNGKRDELAAAVRLNAHKASTGYSAWTFDTWTAENLKKYLESQGKKVSKSAEKNRDELVKQAQSQYAVASKSGGSAYASATSYLAKQTDAAKDTMFDSWTDSDIKAYLDSYGIPTYQGTTSNELRAEARKQYNYFKYGSSSPTGTIFAQIYSGVQKVFNMIMPYASSASATASSSARSAASVAAASASSAAASVKSEL